METPLDRPPNVIPRFRKGVRFDAGRMNQLVEAINRTNTGIAPPVQVEPDTQQISHVATPIF